MSDDLKNFLKLKKLRYCEFARLCELSPCSISGFTRGWLPMGRKSQEKIESGLNRLGCAQHQIEKIIKQLS